MWKLQISCCRACHKIWLEVMEIQQRGKCHFRVFCPRAAFSFPTKTINTRNVYAFIFNIPKKCDLQEYYTPSLYNKELFNYLASNNAKTCQPKLFGVEYMWKYVEYSRLPWRPHIFVNILANGLRGLEWMGTHLYPPFPFCLFHISCWSSWETAMLSIMIIRNKPNWRIPRRRLRGKLRPEKDES